MPAPLRSLAAASRFGIASRRELVDNLAAQHDGVLRVLDTYVQGRRVGHDSSDSLFASA